MNQACLLPNLLVTVSHKEVVFGMHHPLGHTNGAISQITREENAIMFGCQNLTERRDDEVFVDLNVDDDDDDDDEEATVTSNAACPTPTPIAADTNTHATTDNVKPDAIDSVIPSTNTGKNERKKFDLETIIISNKERTESLM